MKKTLYNFKHLIPKYNYSTHYLNMNQQKGKFIVLEGLDRSGKSSVTKYLK